MKVSEIPHTPLPDLSGVAWVYALVDPRDDEVKYIGLAQDPYVRYKAHANGSQNTSSNARREWVLSLRSSGLKPVMVLLEKVSVREGRQAEETWIQRCERKGARLLNEFRVRPLSKYNNMNINEVKQLLS